MSLLIKDVSEAQFKPLDKATLEIVENFCKRGTIIFKPPSEKKGLVKYRINSNSWAKRYIWVESNGITYGPNRESQAKWFAFAEMTVATPASRRNMLESGAPEELVNFGLRLGTEEKWFLFAFLSEEARDAFLMYVREKAQLKEDFFFK